MRHRPHATPVAALLTTLAAGVTAPALADVSPDAGMLRDPDISADAIVFTYANDIWVVDRDGGTARPLASPPGAELRPRFNDAGDTIAFVGNYDGGRDIYTIDAMGGLPHRVTHHPTAETLCDWSGDDIVFSASGMAGLHRMPKVFTVDHEGGMPNRLPMPYGAAAAISPDGTWVAYTPNNRDGRTWKRYRGGMASDIWLVNLENGESRRATDWEGTDTQPMWSPDGSTLYYLSDAGDEHRLNIWKYDVASGDVEQVTDFEDFDVKSVSIGPGPRGRGEIIFQHGPDLKVLDLARNRTRTIEVRIPGARPTLRPQMVDVSNSVAAFDLSPNAKRAVVESRGDIWTLPAENGSPRNLTDSDGAADRDPAWSPDGRWVAYFSDASGEYELYVTQSDGKGETMQLTDGSKTYYYNPIWSPDSKKLFFTDKAAKMYLYDFESETTREFDRDPMGNVGGASWSHDSRWLTYTRSGDDSMISSVWLYDVDADETHQVTHGMFGDASPVFDRKGDYLYFSSSRRFQPTYSDIDTTFVYNQSGVLLAVPLRAEMDSPWSLESDEETWKDASADEAHDGDHDDSHDDAHDDGDHDDHDGDHAHDDDADHDHDHGAAGDVDAADVQVLAGTWKGTVSGLSAVGAPPDMDTVDFTMTLEVDDDGTITGESEAMGEVSEFDRITFDATKGTFEATTTEDGVTSVMRGTLEGDTLSGEWELVEIGVSGEWEATKKDGGDAAAVIFHPQAFAPAPTVAATTTSDFGDFDGTSLAFGTDPGHASSMTIAETTFDPTPVVRDRRPATAPSTGNAFRAIREAAARAAIDRAIAERLDTLGLAADVVGSWSGSLSGLSSMGLPPEMDTIPFGMEISKRGGSYSATFEAMGESDGMDSVTFDPDTNRFEARDTTDGMSSVMRGTLSGNTLSGEWEVDAVGASGTWTADRAGGGGAAAGGDAAASSGGDDDADDEARDDDGDDEGLQIDLEGFEARAMQLPVPPGNFGQLAVNNRNQLLYVRIGGANTGIKAFDMTADSPSEQDVQRGATAFALSADGSKMIIPQGGGGAIRNAGPGGGPKPVVTRGMMTEIDPRTEWEQVLRDAWRIQRDFFYVDNMHGVDWEGVYDQYAAMLPDAMTRDDVSYIIREMISELNVGHAYYFGGPTEPQPSMNVGMLGVDFEHDGDGYKIAHIIHGADWDADARNPLHLQGADVNEGDYLVAVNGHMVDPDVDPWAPFVGTANREITITVNDVPEMNDDARTVVVRPISNDGRLRYRAWIESNRKLVEEMSDGTVGYIYVPNTGVDGQSDLFRQFYGQINRKALIIDERWNGGGQIPTRFIELLNRPITNYWARRDGRDWTWPPDAHHGPKAMLINGLAGSGGDMFPWLFKQADLGPLIGTRTWGGLVGISGNPTLIDGGYTAAPTFGFYETDGTWGIEGHGVDPDIEVIDDPALMLDGGDPQLERAIEEMKKAIRRYDFPRPNRPDDPDRSGMGITEDDK